MRLRRSILVCIYLAAFLGGLYVQISSSQHTWLSNLDRALSPVKSETFQTGAIVADRHIPGQRNLTIRKILGPSKVALDYLICSIDDDPDQMNAFGIYHPADLAITCLNLQKLGVKRALLATHLHWPELDRASNATLASAIKKFDQTVISTPLRRQFNGSNISKAFLRSSISVETVDGDASLLAVVNHQVLPPTIEIPNNAWIGFSNIELEESLGSVPLIALWDDRIVLASSLLHMIQRAGIELDQVDISLGSCIRLGKNGHFIPIDKFGRLQYQQGLITPTAERTITSANSASASIIGASQENLILMADGTNTKKFASIPNVLEQITQLLNTPRAGAPELVQRMAIWSELTLLAVVCLTTIYLACYNGLRLIISYLCIFLTLWISFLILYQTLHFWIPMNSYLSALLIGWTLTTILVKPLTRS